MNLGLEIVKPKTPTKVETRGGRRDQIAELARVVFANVWEVPTLTSPQGRYKATWKREFKLLSRKAGLLKSP